MKNKKIVIGISVVLGACLIIGITYAFWRVTKSQVDNNLVASGCFAIDFVDSNDINLTEVVPIDDVEGLKLIPYEFTLTNTCTIFSEYQINLEILNTTTTSLDYIKLSLDSRTPFILSSKEEVEETLDNSTSSYNIGTGKLNINSSKTHTLRIWLDKDTPVSEMNTYFESKVTVIATPAIKTFENGSVFVENAMLSKIISTSDGGYLFSYINASNKISYKKYNADHDLVLEKDINFASGYTMLIGITEQDNEYYILAITDNGVNILKLDSELEIVSNVDITQVFDDVSVADKFPPAYYSLFDMVTFHENSFTVILIDLRTIANISYDGTVNWQTMVNENSYFLQALSIKEIENKIYVTGVNQITSTDVAQPFIAEYNSVGGQIKTTTIISESDKTIMNITKIGDDFYVGAYGAKGLSGSLSSIVSELYKLDINFNVIDIKTLSGIPVKLTTINNKPNVLSMDNSFGVFYLYEIETDLTYTQILPEIECSVSDTVHSYLDVIELMNGNFATIYTCVVPFS